MAIEETKRSSMAGCQPRAQGLKAHGACVNAVTGGRHQGDGETEHGEPGRDSTKQHKAFCIRSRTGTIQAGTVEFAKP
jgi:hypothetical protein